MQNNDQKEAFIRIIKASIVNIAGFGFATYLIDYLAKNTNIGTPVMVLALLVFFVIFVSISALLVFIYKTVQQIPKTMAAKPANLTFIDIYGFTMAALFIRLIEAAICVFFIVHIYKLFL